MNAMRTNLEAFLDIYVPCLFAGITRNSEIQTKDMVTFSRLIRDVFDAHLYDKDGAIFKSVCKELGIKAKTYAEFREHFAS